jgi:hypothetical protein
MKFVLIGIVLLVGLASCGPADDRYAQPAETPKPTATPSPAATPKIPFPMQDVPGLPILKPIRPGGK